MKWKTPEKREYYSKYEQVDIKNGAGWFECYKLPHDVYCICEPQHLQEVNAFLIIGSERALLLDTGMGICNIKAVVDELYQGELTVVNCHFHFDHTGNNWRFDKVLAADDPFVSKTAEHGLSGAPLANQADEDMFLFGYPEGFIPEEYQTKPYNVDFVEDGHVFHLGGRDIEFIRTPGHTADHAMLYDKTNDILFSGDMVYGGAIYIQFDSEYFGSSNIDQYIASLEMVRERYPDMKEVYASHNDIIVPPERIDIIHDALVAVRDGQVPGEPLHDEKYGYYGDPKTLMEYKFDGFSIVARH